MSYQYQKNRAKKKKRRRQSAHLLLIFVCTLTIVVAAGLGAVLLHNWVNEDTSAQARVYAHYLTKEPIPEDASDEEVAAAVSAAVEEFREENSKYADIIEDQDYLIDNNIYVKEAKNPESDKVTVTFAGDILFDSNYAVMAKLIQNGGQISSGIDQKLLNIMNDSDIMMLNNEFPYSDRGTPTEGKTFTFRADPQTASYLNDMDVDLVSLANNHAYDYGEDALLDTFDTLDSVGVAYVGAGHDINEASQPVYYIINNIKIGFLSATQIERLDNPDTKGATETSPGVFRCWNDAKLLEKIKETKENCDFLVVYVHWGTESTTETDWAQQEQAPEYVQAGADLIIGDHPHVLQPVSVINGVPVVYSLGNFWFNSKELDTCMIQATIDGNGLSSLQFIPAKQANSVTTLLTGEDAIAEISRMQAMSPNVTIDSNGYITY